MKTAIAVRVARICLWNDNPVTSIGIILTIDRLALAPVAKARVVAVDTMLDFVRPWNFHTGRSAYWGTQSQVYDVSSLEAPPGTLGVADGGDSCQTEESAGAGRELADETVGAAGGASEGD